MRYLLTFVCTALFLVACNDDENEEWAPHSHSSRTVLVYMAGENNLTVSNGYRYLNNDLKEILQGAKLLKDDQRLFVFVDSLNTNSQQASKPYIIEVHGEKTYVRHEFDTEFYSSDPARFHDIIDWVTKYAPANDYGLVLWGHASGWLVENDTISRSRTTRAYGQDDGSDSMKEGIKWMNITQMAHAMKGLPKMEFIFADCCNMMCAEVGYELREATNYLIGSPAEIPGDGAPYNIITPFFYKKGSEIYKSIIDAYYNEYIKEYQGYYELDGYSVPLSVIDTRYIQELAQATHHVLEQFSTPFPHYPESPNLRNDSITFYMYYDAPVMYDMRAFVKKYTTAETFKIWDITYQKAVPYYRMSMKWMTTSSFMMTSFDNFSEEESNNGCVSMFIPLNKSVYDTIPFYYNSTFNNYGWNKVIDWSRFGYAKY